MKQTKTKSYEKKDIADKEYKKICKEIYKNPHSQKIIIDNSPKVSKIELPLLTDNGSVIYLVLEDTTLNQVLTTVNELKKV